MMNAAFAELGLDWRYLKLPVPPEWFAFVETSTDADFAPSTTWAFVRM